MRTRTLRHKRMEPKEHASQKTVVALLRLSGAIVIDADVMDGLKFFGDDDQRRYQFIRHHKEMGYTKGQPDIVFIRAGRVFFVEMKTATGRQSPEQKEFERQIEESGQTYLVWRSINDCEKWIDAQRHNGDGVASTSFAAGSSRPSPSIS